MFFKAKVKTRIQPVFFTVPYFIHLQCLIFWCHTCLGSSDVDRISNCSLKPKITPQGGNNYTVLPSPENDYTSDIIVEGKYDIELSCRSKLPVKFKFEGFKSDLKIKSAMTIRHTRDSDWENPEYFCHETVIKVKPTIDATGKYACSHVTKDEKMNVNSTTNIYLYIKTKTDISILGAGETIHLKVSPHDTTLVIPCRVKHPNITTSLKKDGVIQNSTIVQKYYEPKVGYTLPISENITDVLGIYKCQPINRKKWDHIETNVSLADERLVEGFKSDKCVEKVKIRIGSGDQGQNETNLICKSAGGVRCFKYFHCATPTECDILAESFFDAQNECDEKRICSIETLKSFNVTKRYECSILTTKSGAAGTLKCDSKENVKITRRIFTDLNGKIVFDDPDVPLSSTLQIADIPVEVEQLSTEMWYNVSCRASKFRFSKGFKWKFLLNDGTIVKNVTTKKKPSVKFGDNDNANFYSETVELKITHKNIKKIFCLAPVLDSQEWANVSIVVNKIKESTWPKFKNPENQIIVLKPEDKTRNINCEASGFPKPKIKWYYLDAEEIDQKYVTDLTDESIIRLATPGDNTNKHLLGLDYGRNTFICNATNFRGSIFRNITVVVPGNFPINWLVLGLCLFFLIVILPLYILCNIGIEFCLQSVQQIFIVNSLPLPNNVESELNFLVEQFRRGASFDAGTQTDVPPYAIVPYSTDFEIPETSILIILEEQLGEGQFGIVHKGILRDSEGEKEVACKTLKEMNPPNPEAFELLLEEIKILQHVGQHPNVIQCIGAVTRDLQNYNAQIIMEYCSFGNLKDYLINNRTKFHNEFGEQENSFGFSESLVNDSTVISESAPNYMQMEYEIRTSDLVQWALDIATGMQYLADKRLIHRDLAARNVVLNSKKIAKITDFGLCKNLASNTGSNEGKDYYRLFGNGPLPLRWLAPEVLISRVCSVNSDIWAYGITLWEIFTLGEFPYFDASDQDVIKFIIEDGTRLENPLFSNLSIYKIMQDCWKNKGDERPRFSELRERFLDLKKLFYKKDITYSTLQVDSEEFEETYL